MPLNTTSTVRRRSRPLTRSCFIVERKQVFGHRSRKKLRSAEAVVTGKVAKISRQRLPILNRPEMLLKSVKSNEKPTFSIKKDWKSVHGCPGNFEIRVTVTLQIAEMGILMRNEATPPSFLSSMRSSRGLSTSGYCRKGVLMRRGGGAEWQNCWGDGEDEDAVLSSFLASETEKNYAFCGFCV